MFFEKGQAIVSLPGSDIFQIYIYWNIHMTFFQYDIENKFLILQWAYLHMWVLYYKKFSQTRLNFLILYMSAKYRNIYILYMKKKIFRNIKHLPSNFIFK